MAPRGSEDGLFHVPCGSEAALFQVNSVTIPADAFIEPVELEIAGVWTRFSKYYR